MQNRQTDKKPGQGNRDEMPQMRRIFACLAKFRRAGRHWRCGDEENSERTHLLWLFPLPQMRLRLMEKPDGRKCEKRNLIIRFIRIVYKRADRHKYRQWKSKNVGHSVLHKTVRLNV